MVCVDTRLVFDDIWIIIRYVLVLYTCTERYQADVFILGYDTGVISGALVSIGSDLGPEQLANGQKVSLTICTHKSPTGDR